MTRQKTRTIGIVSTGFPGSDIVINPYFAGILHGVLATAEDRGYNVTLFTRVWRDREGSAAWLEQSPTDGIVTMAPSIYTDLFNVLADQVPALVAVGTDAMAVGVPTVDVDNDSGAALATEHLISLGHRRIVHLTGTMTQPSAFVRRDAFYRAMTARGLPVSDHSIVETEYYTPPAYSQALHVLSRTDRPTAIFAANDNIALGVMQAARELEISIPEQLSVVGFDDLPIAALTFPPLTTIKQPFDDMGRLAANLLFQQINGQAPEIRTHVLPASLVVRQSTAPPAEI